MSASGKVSGLLIVLFVGQWAVASGNEGQDSSRCPGSVVEIARSRILVDVREEERYEQAHIPQSLHIPLHEIKTKRFLRTATPVLVDTGWGDPKTEAELERLKKLGFSSVEILHRGINGWCADGGGLEGTSPSPLSVAEIDADDFYRAQKLEHVVVVDARGGAATDTPVPCAVRVPFDRDRPDIFAEEIGRRLRGNPEKVAVLFDEDGVGYAAMRAALESACDLGAVFFVAGGIRGYLDELRILTASPGGGTGSVQGVMARGEAASGGKGCANCP